jgi:hypothetical protein
LQGGKCTVAWVGVATNETDSSVGQIIVLI